MSEVQTHIKYRRILERSKFLLNSYKGGLNTLDGDEYIFKYPTEGVDLYSARKMRAVIYNYFRPIVSMFTNSIFRHQIQRPWVEAERLKVFFDSATTKNESLSKIMRKISLLSTFLRIGVLVDAKKIRETVVEKEKKIKQRLFPYVAIYYPENIIDWYFDDKGLAWVKLAESYIDKSSPTGKHDEVTRYLLFTRDFWQEGVKSDGNKSEETDGISWEKEVRHNLKEVPFIFCYQHDIDPDEAYESNLEDIAMCQRRIANWMSNIDENIWSTCNSGITIPADDNLEKFKEAWQKTSNGRKIYPYPAEGQPPKFLRDDVINIPIVLQAVERDIEEIYKMAELTIQSNKDYYEKSGKSKEYDFYQSGGVILNKAKQLEETENWIIKMFCLYENIVEVSMDKKTKYPEDIKIVEDVEKMNHDLEVITARVCSGLTKYAKKQYVMHAYKDLANESPGTYKQIIDEIDKGNEIFKEEN